MSVEETIQILHSIEDRAGDFPNMTACDWVAIAAAKRHLSTLKANENSVYTKQELRDMGFGFDLNGNIVTPQEIEERSKKYIKYRKDKWVEKTCEWLEPIAEYIGHDSESIKESFKKYINGCD
jgi:leucyl-tRNA synthetase